MREVEQSRLVLIAMFVNRTRMQTLLDCSRNALATMEILSAEPHFLSFLIFTLGYVFIDFFRERGNKRERKKKKH